MPVSRPFLIWVLVAVLLVVAIPLIIMLGMMALGLATGAGMMAQMNGMMSGESGRVTMAFTVMWVLLVTVALVSVIALLVRYAARA
jgi:hypothetical protein